MLNREEKEALVVELGNSAAKKVEAVIAKHDERLASIIEDAKKNKGVTQEQLDVIKEAGEEATAKLTAIAEKQGKVLADLKNAVGVAGAEKGTSIAELLHKDMDKLAEVFKQKNGSISYEILQTSKGEVFMRQFDSIKAAFTHGTIDDIDDASNVSSIAQSLSAASILRLGANADIINQYRNTPYIFDLCNTIQTNAPLAMWIDEKVKEGTSANHVEGTEKSKSQYFYEIKSSDYKTEATLLSFSNKFEIDFTRLQQNAIQSARTDLVSRINAAVQTNIFSAATAYNTGTDFKTVFENADPNDYMALAAMAAQADSATFGSAQSNAVLMSTLKKYAMGILTDEQKNWLNAPDVLAPLSFVGNAGVGIDDVIVGDFKQYNILLRGGIIMRIGWNLDDLAKNKFSVVLEQDYFDYISTIRAKALVKGQTFAAVKEAIKTV